MITQKAIKTILKRLDEQYGREFVCYLNYTPGRDYELLFATILSAQCTDERVNLVTKDLFKKYNSLLKICKTAPGFCWKNTMAGCRGR